MNIGETVNKLLRRKPTHRYVSEIDQFLQDFDKSHTLSDSQKEEIEKHQRIAHLRDNPESEDLSSKIWEKF